jgi:cation transport regulator ChaC
MWIFGYGSLIWKTGFPFEERVPGYVRGWSRKFWQGSPDHRGTEENLGRVVTLVEQPDAMVWGVAYRIHQDHVSEVLEQLDFREKGGYTTIEVPVWNKAHEIEVPTAMAYLATSDNPYYLGDASPLQIAQHIQRSHGPSGSNLEYLMSLHHALVAMKVDDDHVRELVEALRMI